MIPSSLPRFGHSANVKMQLLVNGSSLSIAQMGPDFLLLRSGVEHPPGEASILLRVDASERQWKVHLPEGVAAGEGTQRVSIALPPV